MSGGGYFLAVWLTCPPWQGPGTAQAREQLQAWMLSELEQVSDRCACLPPDRWLLDLHGMESCLGPAPEIARRLETRLRAQGLEARLGLGPTRTSALLAAQAGVPPILADDPAPALARLPLAVLAALHHCGGDALAGLDLFTRWGLRTLGEVAGLPQRALAERLGQAGLDCQLWARGQDQGLLLPSPPASEPARCEQIFEPAVEGYLPLLPWLDQQVRTQAAEWERADRALAACTLELELRDASPWCWRYAPPLPHRDARRCLRQLETALALRPPPAPITAIKIEFRLLRPRRLQAGLFGDTAVEEENRERLLARLRVLLDDPEGQRCGSPRLRDVHRDDSFAMVPYQPSAIHHPPSVARGGPALRVYRPAPVIRWEPPRLSAQDECWREPQRGCFALLELAAAPAYFPGSARWDTRPFRIAQPCAPILPTVQSGATPANGFSPVGAMCSASGMPPRRVRRAWGPWRSSGAWWSETAWSHDDWDVEFTSGSRARLRNDRRARRWFLLGEYD
ncbi:MAG: hypothetical protein ACRD1C_10890 [Terriglobales bacterium]